MRRLAWRLYLGTGALLTGAYYLLPDGPGAVLNVVVGASAVAAIVVGLRWHRPARPLPWRLIAGAQGLFVVGDALFSVNELVLGIDPFPSLADALYLPGYPVLAAGLTLLALSRSSGRRDWAGLTDAAIIAIGFGLLSWVLVMVPTSTTRPWGWSSCWSRSPTRSATCSCWPWRPGWPPARAGARPPSGC